MSDASDSDDKTDVKLVGFSLGRWPRVLCGLVGLGLLALGAFLAIDGGDGAATVLALALGGILFVLALIGKFGAIEIPTGSGGSFRVEPPHEPPASAPPPSTQEPSPPPTETAADPDAASESSSERAAFVEALDAWFESDHATFDTKMLAAIDEETDVDTKLNLKCLRLAYLYGTGQTDNLRQLQQLQDETPTSRLPIHWIGHCYEVAEDWGRAAEVYEGFYNDARLSEPDRVRVLISLSNALRKNQKLDEAQQRLDSGLATVQNDDDRASIHTELAAIHHESARQRERFWHLEQALILNPGDVDTRFKLAYAYAESKDDLMALHHYEILDSQRSGATEQNNLALIYNRLGLPITSVRHYRTSISMHYTLASSNLARKAGKAGLIKEAKAILESAQTEAVVDASVHTTMGQLSDWDDAEGERVARIKEAAKTERDLFLSMCALEQQTPGAYTPTQVQGLWNSNFGDMTFRAVGSGLHATFKDEYWDWTLDGQLEGRVYRFEWTNDRRSQNQNGDGYLVFETESTFRGILRHSPAMGEIKEISASQKRDLPPAATAT